MSTKMDEDDWAHTLVVDCPRICGERFEVYAACLSN